MCAPERTAFVRAYVRVPVCESAKRRKGRAKGERGRVRGGGEREELRWRIYERPKQAANPKPFARSFSPPFFTSYFDLSARVEYTWPCLAAAPRRAHAKTQFHPVLRRLSPSHVHLRSHPYRPPLWKFYIVSIVVVTSRRFDYAARSAGCSLLFVAYLTSGGAVACSRDRTAVRSRGKSMTVVIPSLSVSLSFYPFT